MTWKSIYLTLLITLPTICRGQSDVVYFDNNWELTTVDGASFYRTFFRNQDGSYKVEDRFMTTKKLQMTGTYNSRAMKARKNGFFCYYYDNGFKEHEGIYENDEKSGIWKDYDAETGHVSSISHYKNGKLHGESIYFFATDTSKIWHTENYVNGRIEGDLYSYYESGKLKRKEHHNTNDTNVTGVCYDERGKEIHFTPFSRMPQPKFSMNDFLTKTLRYPDAARLRDIEGRVNIKFQVLEDGTISHPEITKSADPSLDKEALRVVSRMPEWEPGIEDDKVLKVYFSLPIQFRLE